MYIYFYVCVCVILEGNCWIFIITLYAPEGEKVFLRDSELFQKDFVYSFLDKIQILWVVVMVGERESCSSKSISLLSELQFNQ